MDPITRAARTFLAEAEAFFRAGRGPLLPMITGWSERTDLIKTLKLHELAEENRWPLFLFEEPFVEPRAYGDGLADSIKAGYELIRRGAEEEGVVLPLFSEPEALPGDASPGLPRAARTLERAASLLGERLAGVLLALVPSRVGDPEGWRDTIAALQRTRFSPRVRLSVFAPPKGPLAEILGGDGAHFHVDPDELLAHMKHLGTGGSAGPVRAPPPAPTEEQRRAFEAATGRKLPTPEAALRLRTLLLDAAQRTAQRKHAEAGDLYREARSLCQIEGLSLEEAMVLVALGGACLALGLPDLAVESYQKAADLARSREAWQVACQAWLGVAGAHLHAKRPEPAALAYRTAADAAKRAEIPVLRIEALRMEGTCLLMLGSKERAAPVFQDAVDEGVQFGPAERKATTFPQAATALVELLRRLGLHPQADHVQLLLDAPEAPPPPPVIRAEPPPALIMREPEVAADAGVAQARELDPCDTLPLSRVPERPVLPFLPGEERGGTDTVDMPLDAAPAGITLEQYASLCAEIDVFPASSGQILQRYGITSMRERVMWEQPWLQRIRKNPEDQRAWEMLYERYRAYWSDLASRGTGP